MTESALRPARLLPTGPSDLPATVGGRAPVAPPADWSGAFRSMASDVNVRISAPAAGAEAAYADVQEVFAAVEAECTRFDAGSDLMRANAAGENWHAVGRYCYAAIVEAAAAHRITAGMFDPRVLRTLSALGYDHSVPFASGELDLGGRPPAGHPQRERWAPAFDEPGRRVRVGSEPIDLGGIGKGLAVRWAAQELARRFRSFVIDAGGDCFLAGDGPDGDGWHVGVEDPRGGSQPVAVLAVSDSGCATSSIRLRHWTVGGTPVHHLLDPRTGLPGGAGLLSVTVVARDPAEAEVWSKVLFLHGAAGIAAAAHTRELAALWVTDDGTVGASDTVLPLLIWRAA